MKFEYVLSGLSHTKVCTRYISDNPTLVLLTQKLLDFMKENTNHEYGLLFNAMTESGFPEFLAHYRDNVKAIHSDSGGLQLAQQGKPLTPEIENKVYRTQVLNSHVAMSIDQIPIVVDPKMGDPRNTMAAKKFVIGENKQAGIDSGKNLKRQIDIFKKYAHEDTYGYNCKPLMIIQGNALEDYQVYVESILAQIPEEDYKYIGGYALAGSAIGIGELEALDTLFSFDALYKPKDIGNRIHLLGYGSVSRLIPIITLRDTIFKDYEISYDSTTHTAKYNFGAVFDSKGNTTKFGTHRSEFNLKLFKEVYNTFGDTLYDVLGVDAEKWAEIITSELTGSTRYHDTNEYHTIHLSGAVVCAMYSVYNFVKIVEATEKNLFRSGKTSTQIYKFIQDNCTSHEDWFGKHRNTLIRNLQSDRIERIPTRDHKDDGLDSFFE